MVSIVKPVLYRSVESNLFRGCLRLLEQIDDRTENLLRVLTYHRIDDPCRLKNLHPGMISATPDQFVRQMQELANHYRVVSLQDVMKAIEEKKPLPARSVLITFDDAYQDFSLFAWPVLKSFNLPVTLFVPTAFPDQPQRSFWWDRLYAALFNTKKVEDVVYHTVQFSLKNKRDRTLSFKKARDLVKSLPHEQAMRLVDSICNDLDAPQMQNHVLGWDELRKLKKQGVTLAPHTQTHPLLNRLETGRAIEQATGSLQDLQRETGDTLPVIAYPAGGVSDCLAENLKKHQFKMAFTTTRGLNDLNSADLLQLRRINVGQATTLSIFRTQLVQEFRWFNRLWS